MSLPASAPGSDPGIERVVTILNKRGLHARAAAKFVKLAAQFAAELTVTKDGVSVSGRSIMGLMMLAAGPGPDRRPVRRGLTPHRPRHWRDRSHSP
jgi:phosphocarrier protein